MGVHFSVGPITTVPDQGELLLDDMLETVGFDHTRQDRDTEFAFWVIHPGNCEQRPLYGWFEGPRQVEGCVYRPQGIAAARAHFADSPRLQQLLALMEEHLDWW